MKSIFVWSVSVVTILILAVSACNRKKTEAEPVAASKSAPVLVRRGSPAGAATSATIGAVGGALKSSDGRLAITIPAGALMTDTTVAIQPLTDTEHIAVGSVYELSPEGTTFAQPVTLTWQLSDAELAGHSIKDIVIASRSAEEGWSAQRGVKRDESGKSVQVFVSHFSIWTASWVKDLPQLVIVPNEATVMVGESLRLIAADVDPAKDDQLLAAPMPPGQQGGSTSATPNSQGGSASGTSDDDLLATPSICSDWMVNRGNDIRYGTISDVHASAATVATYHAPAKVPTPKVVAVSCESRKNGVKILAVANITIIDKPTGWHGNIEYTYSDSHQTSTPNGAGGTVTNFETQSRTAKGQFDLTADKMGWGTVSGTGNGNGKVVETYGMRNPICAMDGGSTTSGDLKVEAGGHAGSGAGDLTVTIHGDNLSMEQHKSDNCSKQSKPYHNESTGPWGVTCELVGVDFSKGGTYEAPVPLDNGHGSCKLTISPQ